MRLLVLGGTQFVGRAIVAAAQQGNHEVTTLNRGRTGQPASGVETLTADRTDPVALHRTLAGGSWDAVIDTWSGAAEYVRDSTRALRHRVAHYCYVSSISVYQWPMPSGVDETAPVVAVDDPAADAYAAAKRGSEIAVAEAFSEHHLTARAGLILGPFENVGRLPWWLRRLHRGGQVLAPGRPGRPLQFIDVRDLASWLVNGVNRGLTGVFNATSPPGHTTTGELLRAGITAVNRQADLRWVDDETLLAAGVQPWTELPLWVPEDAEYGPLYEIDARAAHHNGLRCRPATETVTDTWTWMLAEGDPSGRPDMPLGIDPATERRILTNSVGHHEDV